MHTTLTTDDRLALVEAALHRLTQVVTAKLSPPVPQLTYAQAEKLGFARKTLGRLVARGVFTDHRGVGRKGAAVKLYADELQAYRTDGESGVRRLRQELGRD